MKAKGLIIIIFITLNATFYFLVNSCEHNAQLPADLPEICFESDVLPVFRSSCGISGCHDQSTSSGGYVYTDYTSIMRSVAPNNIKESKAYQAITSAWEEPMPPDRPLPKESRMVIRVWIDQGAKETKCDGSDTIIDTGGEPVCFESDILPVLQSGCAISGCHDAATARGDYVFTSYSTTINGEGIVPYNPTESEMYQAITKNPSDEDFMPPSPYPPLSQPQIDSIYNWIERGALDEECAVTCDTIHPVTYDGVIAGLISNSCKSCHSGTSPSGGISLVNYANVKAIADNGKFLEVVKRTGAKPMPPSYTLPDCQVRQIELWIDGGTVEN